MPRFSANLGFLWTDRPLLDAIAAAGAAGFEAVELHWPYDHEPLVVREACAKAGVRLLAINTRPGDTANGEFGMGCDPARRAAFRASVEEAARWNGAAGGTAIHVLAGMVPAGELETAKKTFAANLALAAEIAADHGLVVLLEPMNPRDRPGYFYSRMANATEMIARVGKPNIRIMADLYHVAISEGDVTTRLERHLDLIGHVQIAAVPSRREPDEGELAFPHLFQTLDRLGYRGHVGAEYRPRGTVEDGLGWLRAARG
jgi:2-dehydrotetronate isomerase